VLKRILLTAIIAGSAASLILFAGVFLKLEPLIRAAETFEGAGHQHSGAQAGTDHGAHEADATTGMARAALTLISNLIAGVGFALVLTAAIACRGSVNRQQGVLWGIAGFAVFSLGPSLGLPPELPGVVSADLHARQLWWATAAGATAAGLALLVFVRSWALKALGIAIALAPHIYGAPGPTGHGAVPAELAAEFAGASLVVNVVFWAVLGWLSGRLFEPPDAQHA
jgi:cobalt transporter subunit CbtA